MEKKSFEEITVEHKGATLLAKAFIWEYGRSGGRDEIQINILSDYSDDPSQNHEQFIFTITDRDTRKCRYKDSPHGAPKPTRPALKALAKYGWYCENFDIESLHLEEGRKVQPSLQHVDDLLGAVIKQPSSPISDNEFLLDVLELSMTGVAFVNQFLISSQAVEEAVESGELPQDMSDGLSDVMDYMAEGNRDTFRSYLIASAIGDSFIKEHIIPMANEHYDLGITTEEIENASVEDFPEEFRDIIDPEEDWRDTPTSDVPDMELYALGDAAGGHKMSKNRTIISEKMKGDTSAGPVNIMFLKVKGSDMPWVYCDSISHVPGDEETKEKIVRKVIERKNAKGENQTWVRSVNDAWDIVRGEDGVRARE